MLFSIILYPNNFKIEFGHLLMNTLFIALPLNKLINNQLERLCFGLPHVHWTEHHHFHLTLLYIGSVDGSLQLDIQEALSKIRMAPFPLSLKGVGYFPSKKSLGSIWAGASSSAELTLLNKIIYNQLKLILPTSDQKPFLPHVSLGRFNTIDKRRLLDYLDSQSSFTTPSFIIDSFVLMKSQQTASETTLCEELKRFPLEAPINKLRILNA